MLKSLLVDEFLERDQDGMKSRCSMNFNVQPYLGVLATLVVGWILGRVAGHPSRSGGDGGLHRCVRLCGSGRHESRPGCDQLTKRSSRLLRSNPPPCDSVRGTISPICAD